MDGKEYLKLHNQFTTLKEVAEEYPNKTIENIIVQIRARLNEIGNIAAEQLNKSKMKKKAMLSQPMAGKTDEEIVATREKAIKTLEEKGYEIVNTLFTDEWYSKEKMSERGVVQIPLCFLAKSLENMSLCHAAYFCKGWENARGCKIEHDAAKAYGLEIIYEE